MLVVLSPAKTLTIDAISIKAAKATPRFAAQADALVAATLSKLSPAALAKLCDVSAPLGTLNHARFQAWNSKDNPRAAAALAFDGPAFRALGAREMGAEALARADERVRCLSGLYGLLKPSDAIQPYRLCMGTKIGTPARDLFALWGERVAAALDSDLDEGLSTRKGESKGREKKKSRVIVNAASQEYWKVCEGKFRKETRVVSVSFPGAPAVYAKQARGAVARFVAENGLDDPQDLIQFVGGGCEGSWSFDATASSEDNYVFFRTSAGKAVATARATAEKKQEQARGGNKRAAAAASVSAAVKAEPAKRARVAATRK